MPYLYASLTDHPHAMQDIYAIELSKKRQVYYNLHLTFHVIDYW